MATGLLSTVANSLLNAVCKATNYTAPTANWVKFHVGAPGAAGTTNPAGNTTRIQATFGSVASGGSIANTASLDWTSVSTSETYTFFTVWDASTAGNFLYSGTVTANAVIAGDNFSVAIGALTVSMVVAS
jgi:hypothetical protein